METTKTIVGNRNEWLDCLRGYAVGIVCIAHFAFLPPIKEALPHLSTYLKGDVGVWLFYVLSGYLIGGLLIKEKERYGDVKLFKFYGRRAARLFPSYALFVAIMWLVATPILKEANIPWWAFVLPWLDMTPNIGYLPFHLRTLHIEEKFYLIWGLLAKHLSKKGLLFIAIGLIVYGPVARILVYLPDGPDTLMFDSAADCFGIGILTAYFSGTRKIASLFARWNWLTTILRPPVILALMLIISSVRTIQPFSYPLVPFLPTVIALLSVCLLLSGWQSRSWMQIAWVSKVGLASYTIYLFQQLVLCPWNEIYTIQFSWGIWILATVLVAGVVMIWFRFVEAPLTLWGRKRFTH